MVREIADLEGGAYPYRRVAPQNQEIGPLLQAAFIGDLEIKNALQQAQAIADRVLAP